jgi:RNA polymerase sigma-70 factor (ECF subfamily)
MGIDCGRSDAELWQAATTGNSKAFGELFERHGRAVFSFCARRTGDLSLAEDLTSIVFLEAWRRRQSVEIDESALPWLLGTANNLARNARRSLRRHNAALRRLPTDESSSDSEDDAVARIDAQRALTSALKAISKLSSEERDVVNLVLWSGVSYDDAARVLGVPVGTVRSRVSRARSKLVDSLTSVVPSTSKELP